jgi:hypothetical protein
VWCEDERLAAAAAAYIILSKKKKQRRKHKVWVRPSLQDRNESGVLRLMNSLSKDDLLSGHIIDGHIQSVILISSSDLEWLLSLVEPLIRKADTNYRAAISPLERLLLKLRFLASGDSFTSLVYLFRISKQAISKIVPGVCDAIVSVLQNQVQVSSVVFCGNTLLDEMEGYL